MEYKKVTETAGNTLDSISKFVVGKRKVVEVLLTALLCEGHILLEGPPGVAKTLMAKTFSQTIGGSFKRIQMTPDLLPSDIIGVNVYNPKDGSFTLRKGPIFGNVILADELNRMNPKTQAALLEAMQEKQVTIEGVTLQLERPFILLATQIPYGEAGTFPLSDVQLDRFAFKVEVDYPTHNEEIEILSRINLIEEGKTEVTLTPKKVLKLAGQARKIHTSVDVKDYIVNLVEEIRGRGDIRVGPSPRASIWIHKASKVKAMLEGRNYVIPDDIKYIASYVLLHRVKVAPEAEFEEVSVHRVIQDALEKTAVPKV